MSLQCIMIFCQNQRFCQDYRKVSNTALSAPTTWMFQSLAPTHSLCLVLCLKYKNGDKCVSSWEIFYKMDTCFDVKLITHRCSFLLLTRVTFVMLLFQVCFGFCTPKIIEGLTIFPSEWKMYARDITFSHICLRLFFRPVTPEFVPGTSYFLQIYP